MFSFPLISSLPAQKLLLVLLTMSLPYHSAWKIQWCVYVSVLMCVNVCDL